MTAPFKYRLVAAALIALAIVLAYVGTLHAPMFFDDIPAIRDNPTIRHWGDWRSLLLPAPSLAQISGVTARPLINLSLAANYAVGGLDPVGYHVVNIAIHLAAALALFGILGRVLARPEFPPSISEGSQPVRLAFAMALLWAVHPLQTESVTCIVQRTESLMGLCLLLTVYAFVRYAAGGACAGSWGAAAFLFCLLGMAAKEVMVVAPILVVLLDRVYFSPSWKESWARHGRLHLALASTWILLAFLVAHYGGRRGTAAGFGQGVDPWSYLLTQCRAIILYLRLSVWPHPLIVDYGMQLVRHPQEVWLQGVILVALLVGAGFCLARRPYLGFLGAWFFLVLAPSSSVVPLVAQTIAEHRMYLPLAAVCCAAVLLLHRYLGRQALAVSVALAAILGVVTWQRNAAYGSVVGLWADTVARVPTNERAHNNLGFELESMPGRLDEAVAHIQEAIRLRPEFAEAHLNMGNAWFQLPGHVHEAILEYQEAVRLKPGLAAAHFDLANAWMRVPGRNSDAIREFERALELDPGNAGIHCNFANALERVPGRLNDAIGQFYAALNLDPKLAEAHFGLGAALLTLPGREDEARRQFEAGLRLSPDDQTARQILESLKAAGH